MDTQFNIFNGMPGAIFSKILDLSMEGKFKNVVNISSVCQAFKNISNDLILNYYNSKTRLSIVYQKGNENFLKKLREKYPELVKTDDDIHRALKKVCKFQNVSLIKYFLTQEKISKLIPQLTILQFFRESKENREPRLNDFGIEKIKWELKESNYSKIEAGDIDFAFSLDSVLSKNDILAVLAKGTGSINKDHSQYFFAGCRFGFLDIVEGLRQQVDTDALPVGFNIACVMEREKIVKFLLDTGVIPQVDDIKVASSGGHQEITDLLIKQPNLFDRLKNNLSLIKACEDNDINIVKEYLNNNGTIATADNLLTDWKTDHNAMANISGILEHGPDFAIVKAAARNRLDIVKILLAADFEPSVNDSRTLYLAAVRGHFEVFETLIKYEEVDPRPYGGAILKSLCKMRKLAIIQMLCKKINSYGGVKENKFFVSDEIENVFREIGSWADIKMIKLLINELPRKKNLAFIFFKTACQNGRASIAKELADQSKLSKHTDYATYKELLQFAQNKGYKKIVDLLYNHSQFEHFEEPPTKRLRQSTSENEDSDTDYDRNGISVEWSHEIDASSSDSDSVDEGSEGEEA